MTFKVLALVSGELDSPIGAYLLANRGLYVDFIHFNAQSYNNGILFYKTKKVYDVFKEKGLVDKLYVVDQEYLLDELFKKVPQDMLILMWRRFMLRIAEHISKKEGYDFLATGDSLGQVASQTLYNLYTLDRVIDMHILRPLLLWNKKDIIKMNHDLGIYAITSIKSSCIVGIPRRARTQVDIKEVEKLERSIDIKKMIMLSEDHLHIY